MRILNNEIQQKFEEFEIKYQHKINSNNKVYHKNKQHIYDLNWLQFNNLLWRIQDKYHINLYYNNH